MNETYLTALELVRKIDLRLSYGRRYYDKQGQPLTHLFDVIEAILNNNLTEEKPNERQR